MEGNMLSSCCGWFWEAGFVVQMWDCLNHFFPPPRLLIFGLHIRSCWSSIQRWKIRHSTWFSFFPSVFCIRNKMAQKCEGRFTCLCLDKKILTIWSCPLADVETEGTICYRDKTLFAAGFYSVDGGSDGFNLSNHFFPFTSHYLCWEL